MKILITGYQGFVGSHFAKHFEGQYEPGVRRWVDRDRWGGQSFFSTNHRQYDLVIHCAAVVGGRANIDGNPLAVAENLAIDSDMFRWALRTRPKQIVYFSSSAVYPLYHQTGHSPHRTLSESFQMLGPSTTIGVPDNTYGWAKLTGEYLAAKAIEAGLDVRIFRPFSGYGPGQSLDYPFPSFIQRAKDKQDPFEIWGDGTQVRDWVHIDDIVGLVVASLKIPDPGPINICSGQPTSFNELKDLVCRKAGYDPKVKYNLDAPKGVQYRVGNPTKMLKIYTPKWTLEDGIAQALTTSD